MAVMPKPLLIRRVTGDSMLPAFRSGRIVIASGLVRRYVPGDVVVLLHNGLEKIKRITDVRIDNAQQEVYVRGDNPDSSTDSRQFGWLPAQTVKGRVIWPASHNLRLK
jgi:phage repressor protein C with HTH and peptisase S24 domain